MSIAMEVNCTPVPSACSRLAWTTRPRRNLTCARRGRPPFETTRICYPSKCNGQRLNRVFDNSHLLSRFIFGVRRSDASRPIKWQRCWCRFAERGQFPSTHRLTRQSIKGVEQSAASFGWMKRMSLNASLLRRLLRPPGRGDRREGRWSR